MANLLNRILGSIRSKWEPFVILLVVLTVVVVAAIILGPHMDSAGNNIIPSGGE